MMKSIKQNQALLQKIKELETRAAEERERSNDRLKLLKTQYEEKAVKDCQLLEKHLDVLSSNYSLLKHQYKSLEQRHTLLQSSFKDVNNVTFNEYISTEANKIAQSQTKDIQREAEAGIELLQNKIKTLSEENKSVKEIITTLNNTICTYLDEVKVLENHDDFLRKDVEMSSVKPQRLKTAKAALDKALKKSKQFLVKKNKDLCEVQFQYDGEDKRFGDEIGFYRKEVVMPKGILKKVEEEKTTAFLMIESLEKINYDLNKTISSNRKEIEALKACNNTLTKEAATSKERQHQYALKEKWYRDEINALEIKIEMMNRKQKQEEEEKVVKEKVEEEKIKDSVQPRKGTPEGESSSAVFTLIPLTESTQKLMIKTEECCYRYGLDISIYNIIAVAYNYYSVYLYSEVTRIDEKLCTCEYDIKCLAWNRQGTLLAIGGGHNENKNNTVQIWDIPNRKIARRLKIKDSYQNCYCLDWKGDTITAGVNSFIYHWNVNNLDDDRDRQGNKALLPISIFKNKYRSDISSIQWSDCRSKFATITNKGYMCIYNEESKLVYDIKAHLESNYLYLQWCSWDDQIIATGCDKGDLKVWKVENNITLIKEATNNSGIYSIKWISSNKTIISAHENNQLLLWEYPSLTIIQTINGHTGIPGCLAINADKSAIVSKSDKEMIFWKPFAEF